MSTTLPSDGYVRELFASNPELREMYLRALDDIQGAARNAAYGLQRVVNMQDLARDAGICIATLNKFIDRETRNPRFTTVFGIAIALGFKITIGPKGVRVVKVAEPKSAKVRGRK